jgi:hypothetical protein
MPSDRSISQQVNEPKRAGLYLYAFAVAWDRFLARPSFIFRTVAHHRVDR